MSAKCSASSTLDDLQRYVLKRSREPGKRGKSVSVGTIRKELATLTTLWNWAAQHGYVSGPLPKVGLKFPKLDEHAPFQTYAQIERQVKRGRLTTADESDLWDCLYLSTAELSDVLAVVRERSTYGFLYPMAFMAAHTGARRSELCRSREVDYDFEAATILIREKKRTKGQTYDAARADDAAAAASARNLVWGQRGESVCLSGRASGRAHASSAI